VGDVISNLHADFDLTMGLSGCASVAEIERAGLLPATRESPVD
jgi:isopentenyl diphosphate isomerase/L-lactate dehydrogenase-like FMN-dependent dehydrogenase